jgi:hypothetical protein
MSRMSPRSKQRPTKKRRKKNPNAVKLGKRSRRSLTPKQRSESARHRHAALTRWKRQPPWHATQRAAWEALTKAEPSG